MKDEFDIVSLEFYRTESDFYRTKIVDDAFPEYITRIKASYSDLLLRLYPLCQRSKKKKQKWEDFKVAYDSFSEKADVAWQAYLNRDINLAIQPLFKFNGREVKKTYFLPSKNCKRYCEELNDAITFIKTGDPSVQSDLDTVKKQFEYHHRGFLYLSTSEAESKIGKKVAPGKWKTLKRLSAEYEQLGNIFINQGQKHDTYSIQNESSQQITITSDAILRYKDYFSHLNRSKRNNELAPHKIILLLAILSLYNDSEQQKRAEITLDDKLKRLFSQYWNKEVNSDIWKNNINQPWRYMESEPFWHKSKSDPNCSYIDTELQGLLKEKATRKILEAFLINLL